MTPQRVVLLGAGHGKRMGRPKVFAEFEGRSFLERILGRCGETAHPVTLVVDPSFRERVSGLLGKLPFTAPRLVEAAGDAPMLQSVQAALGAGDCEQGFWCWPVDAPFISAPAWVQVVEAAEAMPEVIWKPSRGGRSGHPVWFPGWAVPRILAGQWPNGLQGLLEENEARIHVLELEGEELGNFNTPEQLAAYGGPGGETV